MCKVLGEHSQDIELERTFIVFQDRMQGHKTPTQTVLTVAPFEKYSVKLVWIKSHCKIHLPRDELDRKLLKILTSELLLEDSYYFAKQRKLEDCSKQSKQY